MKEETGKGKATAATEEPATGTGPAGRIPPLASVGEKTEPALSRRAFLWLGSALAGLLTITELVKGVLELKEARESRIQTREDRSEMLRTIFFSGLGGTVALVPGTQHLSWSQAAPGGYSDDQAALMALQGIFPVSPRYVRAKPEDAYKAAGGVIAAGAQFSNLIARDVLHSAQVSGNPHRLRLGSKLASVSFNLELGSTTELLRRDLDGDDRREPNNGVVFSDGHVERSVLHGPSREPATGLLLYSKLPHPISPEDTVVLWSGNIGPSTEATRLIFETPDVVSDRDLQNIRDRLGGAPYYQILFEVSDIDYDQRGGRHVASNVSLHRAGVKAVDVEGI